MHYLFVYFLSELNMYSDTGVGWNFHRGVEILKIPDNVGSGASWRKERLAELAD